MNKISKKNSLKNKQTLFNLWSAEFINRSSYMTGKFALPFFAKNLGAGTTLIGTITSISTLTGIFLKPLIGGIGDKFDKKKLLLIANLIFAFTPLLYIYIDQTYQLVVIRLFHGLSTAIYGPITLAIISTVYSEQRATYLGWFGTARTIGYLIGPILGGLLLLYFDSQNLFFITGIISFLSFLPIILDQKSSQKINTTNSTSNEIILFLKKLFTITKLKQVWVVSLIEWSFYAVFYSMKVFIPIYLVNSGYNFLIGKTPAQDLPRFPDMTNIYNEIPGLKSTSVHTVGPERFKLKLDTTNVVSESVGLIAPVWHYVGINVYAQNFKG